MSVRVAVWFNASKNKLVKAHVEWRPTERKKEGTGRQGRKIKISVSRKPTWFLRYL